VLAACRAIWEFFSGRVTLEPWDGETPLPTDEAGLGRTLSP
jgi:hypothetical protein